MYHNLYVYFVPDCNPAEKQKTDNTDNRRANSTEGGNFPTR